MYFFLRVHNQKSGTFFHCFLVMRIGKKSKDPESKSQLIESVQRLICTTKSQSQPIKGRPEYLGFTKLPENGLTLSRKPVQSHDWSL